MCRPFFAVRLLVVAVVVAILGTSSAAGATPSRLPSQHSAPRLVVSARRVMVDAPIGMAVVGVAPGALVEVRLSIVGGGQTLANGRVWASHAVFRADRWGRVDVVTDAPVAGDYRGVDAMGLFWSARSTPLPTSVAQRWTERVHVSAAVGGREIGATDVIRLFLAPDARASAVRDRGLVGTLFTPAGAGRHPAVIVVGGSEGGKTFAELRAALLASHGYTALALAYFDPTGKLPGLPRDLSLIPLEYFGTAIDWLSRQPTVDATRLGFIGGSRGGELALLLGTRFPQLRAVVSIAPSSVVWSGISNTNPAVFFKSAWTQHGKPVPFLIPKIGAGPTGFDWYLAALNDPHADPRASIPVERIKGPVLLLNGADDRLWPSPQMADRIMARLHAHRHRYPDEHVSYAGNGHVFQLPNEATTQLVPPDFPNGGNPVDSARAARQSWREFLRFLDDNLGAGHLGNIFKTTFTRCNTLHVGYNRFKDGTVVHWNVSTNGVGKVAAGQFTAIGGGKLGSKTYHFIDIPLGTTLPSEASGIQSHMHFHWSNGDYTATRDPGC